MMWLILAFVDCESYLVQWSLFEEVAWCVLQGAAYQWKLPTDCSRATHGKHKAGAVKILVTLLCQHTNRNIVMFEDNLFN